MDLKSWKISLLSVFYVEPDYQASIYFQIILESQAVLEIITSLDMIPAKNSQMIRFAVQRGRKGATLH